MRGGWRACADRCARREQACLPLQPSLSCPALDSLLHSAAGSTASTATFGNIFASALSVAACAFFVVFVLFFSRSWLPRVSLKGVVELRGGAHGGCAGAAARRLSSGGSGGPPARLRQLWRRFSARLLLSLCARAAEKIGA